MRTVLLGGAHGHDEPRVACQNLPDARRGEVLEPERFAVKRSGVAHWEIAAIVEAIVLGRWLAQPDVGWAVAAGLGAAALLLLGVTGGRPRALLVAVAAVAGAVLAGRASLRVRAIEREWDAVREELVSRASGRLDAMLLDAVTAVQRLGDAGFAARARPPEQAFERLARAAAGGVERGVVVLAATGQPHAWAGRMRLPPAADGASLEGSITPFYAVLSAERQSEDGTRAVAHVTLAADSAIPDRERTLAARFMRQTGAAIRFYPAGRGPNTTDVFDYCVPYGVDAAALGDTRSCKVAGADTLFSVRMIPPTQGAYKLGVRDAGVRRVSAALLLVLVALLFMGGTAGRVGAVLTGGGVLVLTPGGTALFGSDVFSAATYFQEALGPFSASTGALTVTAGVLLAAAVVVWRATIGRHAAGFVGAAGLIVLAPFVLDGLAAGITPPAAGADTASWLGWEIALTFAGAAGLVLAAALIRPRQPAAAPVWMSLLAVAWAGGAAIVGLVLWEPVSGWAGWYPWVWLPAALLAVQPAPPIRFGGVVAAVAGAAASLLTWGAAAEGRLLLAERDVANLRQASDAIAVGLLERFADRVLDAEPAENAAELYARWSRSPLEADRYPAVLASWDPGGILLARLALAELDVGFDRMRAVGMGAAQAGVPLIEEVTGLPGTHYLLGVPFPDGSVVTVALGPRSRAIAPVPVAEFLKGEPLVAPPYEITVLPPVGESLPPEAGQLQWRRQGWVARGEERLDVPGGSRHIHVRVPLGALPSLAVRGALLVVLDALLLAGLWMLADWLQGRLRMPAGFRQAVRRPTYRLRLALVLAVFFVVPTLGFATWAARRLAADADRARDLIIGQTLQDAAGSARELVLRPEPAAGERLEDLGDRLSADLIVYQGGRLTLASAPVLEELGLVDRYLPQPAYEELVRGDEVEASLDRQVAGRPTRVGYRSLGVLGDQTVVLAAPRLVEDADLVRREEDLAFGLLLVTLAGLAAAAGLATVAARSLSRPVRALQEAAERVGRGEDPRPFEPDIPGEFVPVLDAFEQMWRDVTAGRAALEAQRRRTATVLRNVATGVVAFDRQLQIRIANPRAEELLETALPVGAPVREATAAEWGAIWEWVLGARPSALGARRSALGTGLTAGAAGDEDVRDFSVGEREIRVQRASLGEDGGWVVAIDDITELTHAVRVLAWGELARQIAHEIKNPLTPIRLGIQHLRRSYRAPRSEYEATLDQTSQQILAEIERLDAIARAFSRFGAPPAGAEPLAAVDLLEVARDTAALYTLGHGATIDVRSGGAAFGSARRDELKEVLINLVENARTAGAQRIVISVQDGRAGAAQIVVQDDGKGIAPEHLPRIFEPQFSTTTSGSGLGLAISRRLVESWGGVIRVESEAGRGTRVVIELAGTPNGG